jgi:hypothetical protein
VGGGALQYRVHVVLERFMAEVGADINEVHAIHRPDKNAHCGVPVPRRKCGKT